MRGGGVLRCRLALGDTAISSNDERLIAAPQELDIDGAHALWPRIEGAIGWNSAVLLDMSGCEFLDSTGLGLIVRAARELRGRESRLGIVGLKGQPRQLFKLTRTDSSREIDVFQRVDEARAELGLSSV